MLYNSLRVPSVGVHPKDGFLRMYVPDFKADAVGVICIGYFRTRTMGGVWRQLLVCF